MKEKGKRQSDSENRNATQLRELIGYDARLLDQLHEGILISDRNCIVLYVNPRYTEITGVAFDKIVGKHICEVRPHALLPEVIRKGKPIKGVYRREGDVDYVVNIIPIEIDAHIIGGISVVLDITTVKKMTRALEHSISRLRNIKSSIRSMFPARYTFNDILGESRKIQRIKEIAGKAALSDLNVLLLGESGTGKEMFAHAIHQRSARREKPFIAINCAAIPPSLLESELFGYSDGAFTGAKKGGKVGLLELGENGTIFLDEIGDMNADQQAKILRVLEDKRLLRVGGVSTKEIDIRIVSSTNKNLESLIKKGLFREDLFYRLNAIQIKVPPLRERAEDIPILTRFFLKNMSMDRKTPIRITDEAMSVLQQYDYPGNIRELKHVIEYSVLMSDKQIDLDCLPPNLMKNPPTTPQAPNEIRPLKESIKYHQKMLIRQALKVYGNDLKGKRKACEVLSISLSSLYQKLNS